MHTLHLGQLMLLNWSNNLTSDMGLALDAVSNAAVVAAVKNRGQTFKNCIFSRITH